MRRLAVLFLLCGLFAHACVYSDNEGDGDAAKLPEHVPTAYSVLELFDRSTTNFQIEFKAVPFEPGSEASGIVYWRQAGGQRRIELIEPAPDGGERGSGSFTVELADSSAHSFDRLSCDWGHNLRGELFSTCDHLGDGLAGQVTTDFFYLLTREAMVTAGPTSESVNGIDADCYVVRYPSSLTFQNGKVCLDNLTRIPVFLGEADTGIGFQALAISDISPDEPLRPDLPLRRSFDVSIEELLLPIQSE
jgi:hypothetical protein